MAQLDPSLEPEMNTLAHALSELVQEFYDYRQSRREKGVFTKLQARCRYRDKGSLSPTVEWQENHHCKTPQGKRVFSKHLRRDRNGCVSFRTFSQVAPAEEADVAYALETEMAEIRRAINHLKAIDKALKKYRKAKLVCIGTTYLEVENPPDPLNF